MIDLRNCKPGDKLISKHGKMLTYVAYYSGSHWPHYVRYDDSGKIGSRTDEGYFFSDNRSYCDDDIVEIL